MYTYRATVLRVVDGDTMDLDVDLGFDMRRKMKVRFLGINAPEVSTQEGRDVRDWVRTHAPEGTEVMITTVKDKTEKYGRYLANVYLPGNYVLQAPIDGATLNTYLVETGRAVVYNP